MSKETFRFNVGAIQCIVLHEGSSSFPASRLNDYFSAATPEEISQILDDLGLPHDEAGSHINPLYIESGGLRMLIDTGYQQGAFPNFGNVVGCLASEGIQPEDIDIVFLSHFHPDHINGLLNDEGNAVFPNARYVTSQAEWDYWMSEETLEKIGEERANHMTSILRPLESKFEFVANNDEIIDGVRAIDTPGHTMGHTGLLIESEGERLLDLVDVLHQPVQFVRPDWFHKFDTDGPLASETRRAMLQFAVDEDLLVHFYHLPFPGLGHVVAYGDTYIWKPDA